MERPLRWYDFLTVNAYWLGINISAGIITPVLLPYLVALFMPAEQKNTYLANVRVLGLAVAMLIQPLAGMLSDRSTSRLGTPAALHRRRRVLQHRLSCSSSAPSPAFVGQTAFGVSAAYAVLILGIMLLQFSSNVAQGPMQGLIPDVVPENQRGRASGVKSVFELLPVFLVIFVGPLVDRGQTWLVVGIIMAGFAVTAAITVLFVREEPLAEKPSGGIWEPFLRLVALTAIFVATTQVVVWLVKTSGRWLSGGGATVATQVAVVGLAGLVGMAGAIFVGVYAGAWVGHRRRGARRQTSFIWWVINRLLFLAAVGSIAGLRPVLPARLPGHPQRRDP